MAGKTHFNQLSSSMEELPVLHDVRWFPVDPITTQAHT